MSFEPPADTWASGASPRRGGPGALAMMVVGAVIMATGCLGGGLIGYWAGLANSFASSLATVAMQPVEATLRLEHPPTVALGETFELRVTVQNDAARTRRVRTVDFNGIMCEQLERVAMDPVPPRVHNDQDWHEFTYDTSMPANGSATFLFTLKPKGTGTVTGHVEVYLDEFSSVEQPFSIQVGAGTD